MAKVFIEETTLTAIGDAIRGKEGSTDLVPVTDMATRITSLPSGGGGDITDEELTLTGRLNYAFAYGSWNWLIDKYGSRIKTKDVKSAGYMFSSNDNLKTIPFSINFNSTSTREGNYVDGLFYACSSLESIPKMSNIQPQSLNAAFYNCSRLRNFPADFASYFNWDNVYNFANATDCGQMFPNCHSLRSAPVEIFENVTPEIWASGSYYYFGFQNCYALDELVNLPVPYTVEEWYDDAFQEFVSNCHRLKNLTFALNPITNAPYVVKWTNQTIDLSYNVGHTSYNDTYSIHNYSEWSGVDVNKYITYETYEELKDDPDAWTDDPMYSRYNHHSAVATINSLPDTYDFVQSAGGTNTIKFYKYSGKENDGTNIYLYLTEEEIAVAAAKGWTVALV